MTNHQVSERIEHLLPQEAGVVEHAQRTIMDHLKAFGYDQVMPPLAEEIGLLLDGTDDSLGTLTLRLTDPLDGMPIGIRADITSQIRRIDANHYLKHKINRLCYCGSTIHSRPIKPWLNREQLQAGAELFGGNATKAAVEIIMLVHGCLSRLELKDLAIAIGHAGIANSLLSGISAELTQEICRHLAKRDLVSLNALHKELGAAHAGLAALVSLHGDQRVLDQCKKQMPGKEVAVAITQLKRVSKALGQAGINHTFDLASLSGFEYHTGVAFVVLSGENVIARGGSYGNASRQATGFSLNVRDLAPLLLAPQPHKKFACIRSFEDITWSNKVADLQDQGWSCELLDNWKNLKSGCSAKLVKQQGTWQLERI